MLATRGEEASFIGYIDEKKKKDKKLKISKQVLVVGMHRIYTMSLKGKVGHARVIHFHRSLLTVICSSVKKLTSWISLKLRVLNPVKYVIELIL
jgi:hypothetical protein